MKGVQSSFELSNQLQRGSVCSRCEKSVAEFWARSLPVLPVLCGAGQSAGDTFSIPMLLPLLGRFYSTDFFKLAVRGALQQTVCRVAWKGSWEGSVFDPAAPDTARDNLPHNTTVLLSLKDKKTKRQKDKKTKKTKGQKDKKTKKT